MSAYIGKGKIRLAPFASGDSFWDRAFEDIENTSVFRFSFSEQETTLPDYTNAGGGTDASQKRIDAVTGQIDPRHYTAANLARVLWGSSTAVAATPITGEAHKLRLGKFVPTKRIIDTSVAPVVKKGMDTIAATDYTVSPGGITFKDTVALVGATEGDAITFDYTPQAGANIQAIVTSAPTVSLHFEGVNAVTGKAMIVHGHKVKLGVAQNVDFIGDDFGTLTISLTFEKDDTITTPGLSQYVEINEED